jgi:O-methyltransferase
MRTLLNRVVRRATREKDKALGLVSRKQRALNVGAANSLCTRERLIGLQKLAEEIAQRHDTGDVVECGVYRGGSAVVLAERLLRGTEDRVIWLFDVFSGMPEPGPQDPPEAWGETGTLVSSEEFVRNTFAQAKAPLDHVNIVVGRYEETLPGFKSPPVAFLHLDCDWYESVTLCLDTFYDAVMPGGAVVFDDYGWWSGCRKAVDEFVANRSLDVRLIPIDSTSHYFIKPPNSAAASTRGGYDRSTATNAG